MTTQYDVNYFIRKFEAIPEGEWHSGNYYNHDKTRFCALGHCGGRIRNDGCAESTDESRSLGDLFIHCGLLVGFINDGRHGHYPQPTPKQRILAALADIKRQQEQNNLRQVPGDTRIEDRTPTRYTVRTEAVPSGPAASPVTAALAKEMPCYHLYLGGCCVYCGTTEPATAPVKEAV